MYNEFAPQLSHALESLAKIIDKAEAHCEAKGIKPERILNDGLSPDAFNFTKQVQTVSDFVLRAPARLMGNEPESTPDTETSFTELKARCLKAKAHMDSFSAEDFKGAETIEVVMKTPRGEMKMSGHDYVFSFIYPNFYFHMTTAYQILRHNGVELGKMDFLGRA